MEASQPVKSFLALPSPATADALGAAGCAAGGLARWSWSPLGYRKRVLLRSVSNVASCIENRDANDPGALVALVAHN